MSLTVALFLHLVNIESCNNLSGNCLKSFFYSLSRWSTCFKKLHIVLFCYLLTLFFWNFAITLEIHLVAQQNLLYIFGGVHLNLSHPVSDILKTFGRSAIISQDDTLCSSIVSLSDSAESLLTSSIPNLYLYIFAVKIHGFYFEVNTYGLSEHDIEITYLLLWYESFGISPQQILREGKSYQLQSHLW